MICPDSGNWNHSMTFDGQVFMSKLRGRAEALLLNGNWDYFLVGLQILGLFLCTIALYFCYFHFQLFHYHVTGFYARLGHADAQHLMGDKLLHGKGIDKDEVYSNQINYSISVSPSVRLSVCHTSVQLQFLQSYHKMVLIKVTCYVLGFACNFGTSWLQFKSTITVLIQ